MPARYYVGSMCEWGDTIARELPDFVQREEQRINTRVDIDACMVRLVDELWAARVVTRGVCCSHGENGPGVLVRAADAAKAHAICEGRARVSYWQDDDVVEYRSPVDATLETCEDAAYGQDTDR